MSRLPSRRRYHQLLFVLFLCFLLFILCPAAEVIVATMKNWVKVQSNEEQEHRLVASHQPVTWGQRAQGDLLHQVSFHLKNPHEKEMEDLLKKVSDPSNPQYGQYLTRDQVQDMTRNPDGERMLEGYLQTLGISVSKKGSSAMYATAPLSTWEQFFNTQFYQVTSADVTAIRAHDISLPHDLAHHVAMVGNVVDLPTAVRRGPIIRPAAPHV
jgi:subtilase family serine protease